MASFPLQDLTGKVRKTETHSFAIGGLADIWMGELTRGSATTQIVQWISSYLFHSVRH
jgi:hypothetical protein